MIRAVVLLAAAGVLLLGIRYGTFAAADTDPYGYVSEAELLARGTLRVDQRFADAFPWRDAPSSVIPEGYRAAQEAGSIVPTYPIGLPIVMAAFLTLTGQRDAVFYVVPLAGALLVGLTAMLGTLVHSRRAGAVAAVLLAASPSFLYQVPQPVSDVPAAMWWTLALVLALGSDRRSALGAGVAASMAILTRPNLVPLAAVIGIYYLWAFVRARRADRRLTLRRALLFAAGAVPGCVAVAVLNDVLYGSPLRSGYAPFSELYSWAQVMPNLDRYPRWLVETQTPFIVLALAAPWLATRAKHAWLLLAFALVVIVSYIPYGVFPRDQWSYLRFLLPAFPALFVLSVAVALDRVPHRAIVTAVLVALAVWEAREAVQRGAFVTKDIEARYVEVGRYTAAMPREAVYFAALHSGSIRYYSAHLTINYNRLHPRALQEAVDALIASGRQPYFVIEENEEPGFKWRFDTYTDLGRLDWPPALQTFDGIRVRIYDPRDRAKFFAGQPIATYDIAHRRAPIITAPPNQTPQRVP